MKRMTLSAFIMISVYIVANVYIAICLYLGIIMMLPHMNVWIYAGIYTFFTLSLFVRFFPVSYGLKRFMNQIGVHWIGFFVYFLLFFVVAEIVILIGRVTRLIQSPISPDIRFWSAVIVVLITLVLMLYGKLNALKLRNVSYEVQLKKSGNLGEIKIVMIADLHFGFSSAEKNLPKIVRGINDVCPDVVCIVGDIFNDDVNLIRDRDTAIELLKGIKSKYGVYACLGNHDGGRTFPEMLRFLEQSGVELLNDEYRVIGDRFVLIGRVDTSPIGGFGGLERVGIADIMANIDSELPVVVMDHNPAYISEYGSEHDLVLSAHTHKGQFFPFTIVTKSIFTVDYGYYQKDSESPHIIVTSGVNTWGTPIRIGSTSEIVSITVL